MRMEMSAFLTTSVRRSKQMGSCMHVFCGVWKHAATTEFLVSDTHAGVNGLGTGAFDLRFPTLPGRPCV